MSQNFYKAFATLQKNAKGFGFLVFDQKEYPDAFVPKGLASRFFDADRVAVEFTKNGAIRSIELVAHRYQQLLGRVEYSDGRGGHRALLVVQRRKISMRLPLKGDLRGPKGPAQDGDWCLADIQYHEGRELRVTAVVNRMFGVEVPPEFDIDVIKGEFGLVEEHSANAIAEAKRATQLSPLDQLTERRQDLRNLPFITIDGVTARDFDDAIHVERPSPKGNHVLWVAIADVSHYVRPGTALDAEAYERGTSVYFPERAFHMLPDALSEGACSLMPRVPRMAFVARMVFSPAGERESTQLMTAVIESRRRGIYEEIDRDRTGLEAHFELYNLLRRVRTERGSIDFELPETEVKVDSSGKPTHIERRQRLDTHRLIEEFMIAANEAVTEWALARHVDFLYRIHEEPSPTALEEFERFAKTQGLTLKLSKGGVPTPHSVARVLEKIGEHKAKDLLQSALLRSMKKAVYSDEHRIHFGLASRAYTHFTSPIRRYPDLVVHRLLKDLLHHGPPSRKKKRKGNDRNESELSRIAKHCSYRERVAQEADWEAQRLKKVRLMAAHLGQEYDGKISNVRERGFFVQLTEPYIEGFVATSTLPGDFYRFDEQRLWLVGQRSKKKFQIGDPVRIVVANASFERREIDFTLAESTGNLAPGKKRRL